MACGTPVITSNVSSLPEVAGDAAVMHDPMDTDALRNAMNRFIDDEAVLAGKSCCIGEASRSLFVGKVREGNDCCLPREHGDVSREM